MKAFIFVLSFVFAFSPVGYPVSYAADAVDVNDSVEQEPADQNNEFPEAPAEPDSDEETEAQGPCEDCDSSRLASERDLEPIEVEKDELLGRVPSRKKSRMSVASFPWLPVLAVGGGLLAGYFLYKQYQSNKQANNYTPNPYQPNFPTCRSYAPGNVPGGSPYGSHYYGAGGGCGPSAPAVLPYNYAGYRPGYPSGYPGYQPSYPGYHSSQGYQTGYQMIGAPSYGQPFGMGQPPAVLPPVFADVASSEGRSIASVRSRKSPTKPLVFCPTVNFFGTALPVYNICY